MNIPNRPPEVPDQESPYKSVGGLRRIANALRYSMRGLLLAWRVESAFRQELSLAIVLLPVAIILPLTAFERLALIGSTLLVLIVELLNSSVEAAIDRISLDHHRLSGRAKDFGSAAVFLALLFCACSWILIAGPLLIYQISRLL
ncbi:MAG: diacylglycerol kinase [Burkholderiaceae bacterium]|jgi:diacylglycerol kinase (ATP)